MPIGNIPPPNVHPDEEPFVCIRVNETWIPYLTGALRPMKYPEYWSGTLEENRQARRDVANLIDQLEGTEGCDNVNNCCDRSDLTVQVMVRVTVDNRIEISIDGGSTWSPHPLDPTIKTPQIPPQLTGDGGVDRCNKATNIIERLQDVKQGVTVSLTDVGSFVSFAVDLLGIILEAILIILAQPELEVIIGIIYAWARQWYSRSVEEWEAAWTQEVWDTMLCILYCRIGTDGKFTTSQYNAVLGDIHTKIPAVDGHTYAADSLAQWVQIWHEAGLNVAAATGAAATADCSDCTDCPTCDVTNWSIREAETGHFGEITLVNETENYLEIATTGINTNNGYYIYIQTNDVVAACCSFLNMIMIEGDTVPTVYYWPCGTAINDAGLSFLFDPQHNTMAAAFQMQALVPFKVRVYLGAT